MFLAGHPNHQLVFMRIWQIEPNYLTNALRDFYDQSSLILTECAVQRYQQPFHKLTRTPTLACAAGCHARIAAIAAPPMVSVKLHGPAAHLYRLFP